MLPNDNVWMSVGHLDHVLIVYSSMEHMELHRQIELLESSGCGDDQDLLKL